MPCGSWTCSKCGPAKVYRLSRLVAAADAERFVTLSKVGPDLQTVYRRLQTLSQALRRRGYTWEYLAVPERHQNGSWHLHLIQRGDYIPQKVLSERAESAGMGRVVHIRKIQEPKQAARYLVKYMSKEILSPAFKHTRRYRTSRGFWPGGRAAVEDRAFGAPGGGWAVLQPQDPKQIGKCS